MERPDASAAQEASPEVNSARASPAYYKEALTLTLKRLGRLSRLIGLKATYPARDQLINGRHLDHRARG